MKIILFTSFVVLIYSCANLEKSKRNPAAVDDEGHHIVIGEIEADDFIAAPGKSQSDLDRELKSIVAKEALKACYRKTRNFEKCVIIEDSFESECSDQEKSAAYSKGLLTNCRASILVHYDHQNIIAISQGKRLIAKDKGTYRMTTKFPRDLERNLKRLTKDKAEKECKKQTSNKQSCKVIDETYSFYCSNTLSVYHICKANIFAEYDL